MNTQKDESKDTDLFLPGDDWLSIGSKEGQNQFSQSFPSASPFNIPRQEPLIIDNSSSSQTTLLSTFKDEIQENSFWTQNLEGTQQYSYLNLIMSFIGCGCLVGRMCSPVRKLDWKRYFLSFSFWISIIQILTYIILFFKRDKGCSIFSIDDKTLFKFGALNYKHIKSKFSIYRFITSIILHNSIIHLILNILFQHRLLLVKEGKWGKLKTACLFFGSGAYGCLVFCAINAVAKSNSISVASSSAMFGICGGWIMKMIIERKSLSKGQIIDCCLSIGLYAIGVLLCSLFGCLSFLPNLGGMIGGCLISGIFMIDNRRIVSISIIALLSLILILLAMFIFSP